MDDNDDRSLGVAGCALGLWGVFGGCSERDFLSRLFGARRTIHGACSTSLLINLFVWKPKKREAICQWSVHAAWRLYIDIMRGLGVLTYEIHGEDILKEARGAVVVANHPSLIDVVMLMAFHAADAGSS